MPEFVNDQKRAEHIRALLHERSFNERHGDSTEEIDAELRRLGHEAKPPAKRASTRKR